MGVLEEVLKYKQQRDMEAQADLSMIPQAIQSYQAGEQMRQKNLIDSLTAQASLAKQGLIYDNKTRQIRKEPGLLSEEDMLDTQLKRAQLGYYNQFVNQSVDPNQQGFGSYFFGMSGGKPQVKSDTPVDVANRASGLRKEFNDIPLVKEYQSIRNQVSSMDSLLNASSKNQDSQVALDQGLITLYNKITDPNSVVRESEYERTPENLSLANRLTGAVEKLKKGGAGLTQKDREALVFGAKLIANARGKAYNETLSNYENLANEMKVKPELVTGGYGKHTDFSNKQMVTIKNNKTGETKTVTLEEAKKLGAA